MAASFISFTAALGSPQAVGATDSIIQQVQGWLAWRRLRIDITVVACLPGGHQGEAQFIQHQDVTLDVLIVNNEC
jgi:hypothetical protein